MNADQVQTALKYMVALIVVGGTAEWLADHVSAAAGYGLVYIVLFAYAITGNHIDNIQKFLKSLGLVTQ